MQICKKSYHSYFSFAWLVCPVFIVINFIPSHFPVAQKTPFKSFDEVSFYEQGLAEHNKGNFEEGFAIWERAVKEIKKPDFRISHAYIELVVSQGLKERYIKASKIYEWGLHGEIDSYEKDFLFNDLNYLRPLVGNGDYKDYKRAVKNNKSAVLKKISKFWKSIDPTPLSPYNERLLEHWERINYAKKHYSKKNSDEFDDRAFIYLKFGAPFYSKKGQLNYFSATVSRLVKEGVETPSFATADKLAINSTQRLNMENRVRHYHNYPRYEVWIYRRLTGKSENIIYMFGTQDGTSSFRKIRSIEDFIPSEAYRTSGQNNYSFSTSTSSEQNQGENSQENARLNTLRSSGSKTSKIDFSPALILQLMYYEQFAALDVYFGKSYNEMMNRFVSRANQSREGLAREFGTMYGNKLLHIQNAAPAQKSENNTKLIELTNENYTYRFLDEDNNPYIKLFTVIQFEEAAQYDILRETNSLQTDVTDRYVLSSGYQLMNSSNQRVGGNKDEYLVRSVNRIVKNFDISYRNDSEYGLVSHELHTRNEKNDSLLSSESLFPSSLKGLSNSKFNLPEPLKKDSFIMSDFIIGYGFKGKKESNLAATADDPVNFTIAHDRAIPLGSELNLYYELYNLKPSKEKGLAEYTFQYSIRSKEKGFLGLGEKLGDEQVRITINNTAANSRDDKTIIIDTSNYNKGDYELHITVKDLKSGDSYSKEQHFSIQ